MCESKLRELHDGGAAGGSAETESESQPKAAPVSLGGERVGRRVSPVGVFVAGWSLTRPQPPIITHQKTHTKQGFDFSCLVNKPVRENITPYHTR